MRKYAGLIILIIGIALGAAATVFGPGYIEPYLPEAVKPVENGIQGEVVAKRMEKARLLVTVKSPEGAILITFTKKVPEIDLLVQEGDTIGLNIKAYKPFINDPGISRVMKPDQKPLPETMTKPAPEPMPEPEAMKPVQKNKQKKAEPAPQPKAEETKKPAEAEKPAPEEAAPVTNTTM